MMKALWLLVALSILIVPSQLVLAGTVVAPGARATSEGSISNYYPFAIDIYDPGNPQFNANPLTSQRYQQAYDSSLFAGYTSPLSIEGISFRPDSGVSGGFSATLSDIQINLSTTPWSMGELTNEFAHNVGSDDTIVVDRSSLTLSSSFAGPAGGPKDFDIQIDLDTPFLYDPSLGNLLMDVRNYAGVAGDPPLTMVFDAEWDNPEIYRIYTCYPSLDGVDDATARFAPGAMGLVTQFTFTPSDTGNPGVVPVPGAALLAAIGWGIVAHRQRRTR